MTGFLPNTPLCRSRRWCSLLVVLPAWLRSWSFFVGDRRWAPGPGLVHHSNPMKRCLVLFITIIISTPFSVIQLYVLEPVCIRLILALLPTHQHNRRTLCLVPHQQTSFSCLSYKFFSVTPIGPNLPVPSPSHLPLESYTGVGDRWRRVPVFLEDYDGVDGSASPESNSGTSPSDHARTRLAYSNQRYRLQVFSKYDSFFCVVI